MRPVFEPQTRVAGQKTAEKGVGFFTSGPLFLRSKHTTNVMNETKVVIAAIEKGKPQAAEQLLSLVYDELRHLAASKLASSAPNQTLQPTALVHEAWLKLVGDRDRTFQNRAHFFRAAAEAMRHILIDGARRRQTRRHGGGQVQIDLGEIESHLASPDPSENLLALNEALEKYSQEFPVQAELVKLKYFAGMTNEEISQVLNISVSTAKNYWNFSRAWLLDEMEKG